MDWRIKALVQKAIGYAPRSERLHLYVQRRWGGLRRFDRECDGKIEDWKIMAGHLRSSGIDIAGSTFIEVGTGWYPTLPICNYLAGAKKTITFDRNRYLQPDLTLRCIDRIGGHQASIASTAGCAVDDVEARFERLRGSGTDFDLGTATDQRVDYRAPADASRSYLDENSVDIVFSNSVLEHVPAGDIAALMRESLRILRPGGVMFHSVNCGDHYSYVDPRVGQLNYLRYSERAWKKWDNKFLYQNRLRAIDFVELACEAGFDIVLNTAHPTEKRRAELAAIPVDECFSRYSPDDLCITTIDFIAVKSGRTSSAGDAIELATVEGRQEDVPERASELIP